MRDNWKTKIEHVQLSHIIDFMKEKMVIDACGLCGNTDWGIDKQITDDYFIHNVAFKVTSDDISEKDKRATPVIQLVCTNCGNVRQHSLQVFKKWLVQKYPESATDG